MFHISHISFAFLFFTFLFGFIPFSGNTRLLYDHHLEIIILLTVLSRIQIERLFCCCFCFDFFCFVSMESIRAKVTYSYVVVDDEDDDDGEFDVPDYDDEDGYAMPQA